jgi:hypothetical protein
VALLVAVAEARKVLLDEVHVREGGVTRVDAGVEHRDDDARAGAVGDIGADLVDSPRRGGRGRLLLLEWLDEPGRHDRGDRPDIRITR